MTYHYHGIDAEEPILTKSLPNLGTWALPNLFFINYVAIKLIILVISEKSSGPLNLKRSLCSHLSSFFSLILFFFSCLPCAFFAR